MWQIEKNQESNLTTYQLIFSDFIKKEEMHEWVEASKRELQDAPKEFVVSIDMRDLKPLPQDAQEEMRVGQKIYKGAGMARSAVLVDKTVTKMQFERIGKETGIYEWERYFSSEEPDWEASMKNWLSSAQE